MTSVVERLTAELADRYRIERELGKGGMATVYVAEDLRHKRRVALKVMNPELATTVGADRFLREIETAASLNHPHILPIFDSGQAGELLYYVMPFIEGESLRARLERETQLSVDDALRIAREVADGLGHAHAQGIVHRDIKPENILLSDGHAIIADFGIARAVRTEQTNLTATGVSVGSPAYMSPEQASGIAAIDGRSDLYSLGCMLYEMLAGQPPFTGPTAMAVIARHMADPPPPLRTVRPNVPPAVEAAIAKCMAKVPADRFQTAKALAAALEAKADEPAPRGRAGGWRGMLRPLLHAAAGIAVLAIALFAIDRIRGEDRPRLVVLPFQHSVSAEDAWFVDGMVDEITGRLASIERLAVIARTSALQYSADMPIARIADELDVDYIVLGSIRGQPSGRMRISANLINVEEETQVPLGEIDAVATDSILDVQIRIAEQVVRNLGLVLLDEEQQRVVARATENLTAYEYYLRGNAFYNRSWTQADVDSALLMYERAADIDPKFALAFAQAGKTHVWIHRLGYDATEQRLEKARAAIDKAFELDPDLPEAFISRGLYHYWGRWDYERAIDELTTARGLQPNNAWVYLQLGNIRRRQGEWQDAIANYEAAGDLDPRFHIIWFNIGEVHFQERRYDEADRYFDRALQLTPDFLDALLKKAAVAIHRGDIEAGRQALRLAEERVPPERWRPVPGLWLGGFIRILIGPERLLQLIAPGMYGLDTATYHLARGESLAMLDDNAAARASFDSARVALEALRDVESDQSWIFGALGVALAGLGQRDDAIRAAQRAVELTPVRSDAFDGPDWVVNLARVEAMVGQTDAALESLDLALRIPSRISRNWLRADPAWAALRRDRRFAGLLSSRSNSGSPAERNADDPPPEPR